MIEGIYEYSGIQRCGKSTMLTAEAFRIVKKNQPSRIISNYFIDIPKVEYFNSRLLCHEIIKIKDTKQFDILILFDEMSQYLSGRGYSDKSQTNVASFCWQMPKRRIVLLYSSNIGKSVDLIIRDATWQTILPSYHATNIRANDYISYVVIDNYSLWFTKNNILRRLEWIQKQFDTRQPID